MKKINYYLSFIAILALLFTSCSKEETDVAGLDGQDTFQLQFGTLLNDFSTNQSKIHDIDPMECSDEAPSFIRVAITDSNGIYVGDAGGTTTPSAIQVDLKNNNGNWETMYSEELGLPAGEYNLEYFVVYSAGGDVLWVAPRTGGDFAGSVTNSLPQVIDLQPGTKPYIEVDVLCFIPREEVAYGYLFFDLNFVRVANNYCIFVNYCDDETGREYPAKFKVDVWADAYGGSDLVIDSRENEITAGTNPAASVLCFPLPPLEGDDTYFVRVTVMNDALLPYTSDASDVVQFQINQSDIDAQLTETPRYEHLKINCNPNQGEPYCTPTTSNVSSCTFYCDGGVFGFLSEMGDMGENGFIHITNGNFSDTFKLYIDGTTNAIADVKFEFDINGDLRVKFSNLGSNIIGAFEIDARLPAGSSEAVCNDTRCNADCIHNDDFTEKLEGDVIKPSLMGTGGFFIKVRVREGFCPSL